MQILANIIEILMYSGLAVIGAVTLLYAGLILLEALLDTLDPYIK